MHEITLRGTPAQMGTQHGTIMAQTGLTLPPLDSGLRNLAAGCERIAIQHTPELVEEMRAFADSAHIDYKTLMAFTLTIPLQQTMPSCSVVAVLPGRSANGKLMIGRNYDFAYNISWEAATTYHTYPDSACAHVGSSDIWIGREDGLNESGLFVAMSATFVPGVQAGCHSGLSCATCWNTAQPLTRR
jgi:predicted choloylglycine hydrolase